MPRCKQCGKYTNFIKRGVKRMLRNGDINWMCWQCHPIPKFGKGKGKIDRMTMSNKRKKYLNDKHTAMLLSSYTKED